MTKKTPPLPYSYKANLAEYRRRIGAVRIILALLVSLVLIYQYGVLGWIITAVALTLGLVGFFYLLSTRTITLTAEGLEYRNAFGRRRTVNYTSIESTKVFMNYYEPFSGVFPRIVIGFKKAPSINLLATYWTVEDLERTLSTLSSKGVAVEYYEDVVTYTTIAKQFPRYALYIERHPVQLSFIIIGAIALLAMGIAVYRALQ